MHFFKSIVLITVITLTAAADMYAQDSTAYNNPNAYYYAVVVGNDTFPLLWLPGVTVYGQSRMTPQQRAAYEKLRYNVTKVYPYAITASYVLQDVDAHLAALKTKKEKKAYIKSKENEMKSKFKDQLKNLTMTQGQILVKLINRQTGKDCYSLIKELRGGLNARVSQTAAFLFDNDLKMMYDPYGEDSQIEAIVQEIEARNYYQYQTRVTSAAGGKRN